MLKRTKQLLALLMCMTVVQIGAMAAVFAQEDEGAATGGPTDERGQGAEHRKYPRGATPSPSPSAAPIVTPSPTPSPMVSPTPSPMVSPTPSAMPSPSPSPSPAPTATPSASPTPSPAQLGATLYTTYCAGCHGPLATSNKRGATATAIQTAINNNYGGMGSLSFLTATQIADISAALQ